MINFEEIKKRLHNYKSCFIQEYKETKELISLLKKSLKTPLSDIEKQKVKNQSIDLLKVIPSFVIFMLPGGTLWLFLWFKLIPNMLPSSFRTSTKNKKN